MAAVFLAFKDCEKPVRLKDVVLVTLGKLLKDEGKEAHGQAIEAREVGLSVASRPRPRSLSLSLFLSSASQGDRKEETRPCR